MMFSTQELAVAVAVGAVLATAGTLGCGRVSDRDGSVEAGPEAGETSADAAQDSGSSDTAPQAETSQSDTDRSCTADGGCSAGDYCDLLGCKGGTCKVRPTAPSLDFAPVCGCDGVTYWNSEQAAANGVSAGRSGECVGGGSAPPPPGSCTRFDPSCPTGTHCVLHLLAGFSCDAPDVSGQCWYIPSGATCPSGGGGYRDCTTSKCTNLCGAIRSGIVKPDGC